MAKIVAIVKKVQEEDQLVTLLRAQYQKENKGEFNQEIKPQVTNAKDLEKKILAALQNDNKV